MTEESPKEEILINVTPNEVRAAQSSEYASPGSIVEAVTDLGTAPVDVVKRPFLDPKRQLMRA